MPIPEKTPDQIDFLVVVGGIPDQQKADLVHRALGELPWYNAISKVSTRVMAGRDQVRPTCISLPLSISHSIAPNTLPPQQILSSSFFHRTMIEFYKPIFGPRDIVRPGPVVGCVPNPNSCPNPNPSFHRARVPHHLL